VVTRFLEEGVMDTGNLVALILAVAAGAYVLYYLLRPEDF
jgi:hypothetical protein